MKLQSQQSAHLVVASFYSQAHPLVSHQQVFRKAKKSVRVGFTQVIQLAYGRLRYGGRLGHCNTLSSVVLIIARRTHPVTTNDYI